ncbi:MAG: bifunctional helix-turn-helix transcriptional regulator/GNAT family N-acetyltransferase [Caulobacterales bacterium]|nr:bifunctional helix-turn-helix transcriptional regulator/GNAT family N-acetyltransferase [Caulobacterales bacterium]
MVEPVDTVAAVRRFNRFYTRAIGVLDGAYLGGPYTLAENRVLYEIAHGEGVSASHIAAALDLDPGYLSRMLGRLERDGLVARRRSDSDARSSVLTLTPQGQSYFDGMNARTVAQVEALIGRLSPPERSRLAGALDTAHGLLNGAPAPLEVVLRPHQPGDMGWVTEQHARVYGEEYGWGAGIEALTARICADFLEKFDPARERCWIAERDGVRLGSVFLVRESDEVARLRLLLLTPEARGLGLGRKLVEACVAFAREAGYQEIVLWTHAVLIAARKIYAATGFTVVETWTHDEFGKPEVSETWRLRLSPDAGSPS